MSAADDLARMRAEMDQGREGMKELAGTTHAFFSALLEAGFSQENAIGLTGLWLTNLIQTAPSAAMASDAGEMFKRLFGEGEG